MTDQTTQETTTPTPTVEDAIPKCPNPHCVNGYVGNVRCAVCYDEDIPIGKHGPYGTHTNLDGSPVSRSLPTPTVEGSGKYRKKPVVVDAVHYEGHGNFADHRVPEWMWAAFGNGAARAAYAQTGLEIRTRQGWVVAKPGDWICRQTVNGKDDIWPCDGEAFAATYEPAEVPTPPASRGTEENGCLCGKCGRRYRVDVQVPHALWPKIAGATELLCPRCIADGLEAQGEFAAFRLVDVDSVPASRGTGVPSEKARALVANHEKVAMAAAHLGATELGDAESAVLAHIAELEEQVRTLSAAAEQGERDREAAIAACRSRAESLRGRDPAAANEAEKCALAIEARFADLAAARPPHQGRA